MAARKKPAAEATPATPGETRDRLSALGAVASRFEAWRPATEVLTRVSAVPTRFVQVDRGTRVSGWPIERFATIHGPSNHGKAQPVDEPVLTPNGWAPIGSLHVGDEVIGSDGKPTIVTGVYPQGVLPIYEVMFDDQALTRCCAEHLWYTTTELESVRGVYKRGPRPERKRIATGTSPSGSVKTTAQIAATLDANHSVPYAGAFPGVSLNSGHVDPYVLGLLLGDGCLKSSSWSFTADDDELHDALRREAERHGDSITDATYDRCKTSRIVRGGQGSHVKSAIRSALEALHGSSSEAKYVPREYLWATPEQRLALLQGLMDTDGCVSNEGTQGQFSTTSPQLRDAVVFLTRSLSGRAYVYPHDTGHLPSWCVMISFESGTCPFRLKRKAARWKATRRKMPRKVVSVRPAGTSECVCIRVAAHDALYVTADFILTHNTAFCHGLGLSFLERGHFYALIDAEMTTPEAWLATLMRGQERNPGFVALRPTTFEEAVDSVRGFCETVADARVRGDLPADTTGLIVVDSIKKLVPHRLLEKISKEGAQGKKGSVDGMGGRAAQYRAALVSQWLDEMVPLLHSTKMGMVAIAREAQDPTADANDVMYDRAWKVQGGGALIYDASLVARITRASWVHEGSDKEEKVVGERHKVSIWKTKVGGKAEETIDVFFHTSNGEGDCPEGFDPARDLLETALDLGVFDLGGSWYSFDGKRWQGAAKVLRAMRAEPEMMQAVDAACRAKFGGVP